MKYMGSKNKSKLSKEIAPIINKLIQENNITTYIEPFVGGANMIQHIKCKNKIGSDINDYLIDMWKCLQDGWMPQINDISREMYDDVKNNKEKYGKEFVSIVGFCASYNAKWFGGWGAKANTKDGKTRNYYDEAIRNIQKQLLDLQDVEFIHKDYTYFSDIKNTLIYCDPPYKGTTTYGYDQNFDYDKFWNWVRQISKNNIVLISEYSAPNDFECIYKKEVSVPMNQNDGKKGLEKLFIFNK